MSDEASSADRGWIKSFAWLAIAIVAIQAGVGWAIYAGMPTWAERGQFGDLFGAVNALFSGLAFAGLVLAVVLQKKELALQRQELTLQREEMKLQREEMQLQRAEMERTRVELERTAVAQEATQKELRSQVYLQALAAYATATAALEKSQGPGQLPELRRKLEAFVKDFPADL